MQNKNKTEKRSYLLILNRILVGVIFVSGLYFVASINDLSIKGFILQDLKYRANKLSVENKKMELEAARKEAFENINERALSLNMVKVGKIDYIQVSDGQVAKR
ncbi:MAG: hypothetical protein ABH881_01835 [bacterium]